MAVVKASSHQDFRTVTLLSSRSRRYPCQFGFAFPKPGRLSRLFWIESRPVFACSAASRFQLIDKDLHRTQPASEPVSGCLPIPESELTIVKPKFSTNTRVQPWLGLS